MENIKRKLEILKELEEVMNNLIEINYSDIEDFGYGDWMQELHQAKENGYNWSDEEIEYLVKFIIAA